MNIEDKRKDLLEGLQVLDLADEKASFCSKLLADLGARVIKIERPGGDPSREIEPFVRDSSHPKGSLSFFYNNSNKLGVTLNLDHDNGKKVFLKLVEKADVLIETFPGYLRQRGLGFDVLHIENIRLIYVSVTGFGENGPRSHYKSCDLIASAVGGQMYVSGSPSTPPLKPFGDQSYYTASLFAAVCILLGLRKRVQTGKGEHLDISLQEAAVSTLDQVMVRYFYENTIAKRLGGVNWNHSFCILPCKDGHILLAPFQQWETLVEWMEDEGMAEDLKDEKYREEEYRSSRMNHILEVIERWTKTHTAQELFESGQAMRYPWAPISSIKDVLSNPQLKARRFFVDMEHPEMKKSISYPGSPYKFSHTSIDRWKRAPLIGEDNVRIYQGELGFSDEELQRLSSLGVI
ncbi:MAG TPA: CaiB/BaiF CoA-transferase family protein [Thermodesulfobacteriota bacterium]|nr:CaiB/BaiF CoA-transferase family protein [Thermodesulfobacteriota bacterium]